MTTESITDYHANPAISHSKLECFRRRPALFFKKYVAKSLPQSEESNAFRLGSAVHCAILEESTFADRYAVKPDCDRRTKEGKAQFAEWSAHHLGKTFISAEELVQVIAMREAVASHPIACDLLKTGTPEMTWRVPQANALGALQCRTDWWNAEGCAATEGQPYVVDIKTVESLDSDAFRNFERAAFSYGYHRQAGFYLPLINELHSKPVAQMYYVAIEKVEPFGCAVYRLSDEAVARGQDENIEDLIRLKRCYETGVWPNIEPVVHELGLPKWYGRDAT
jgi:exodeoxyribonuclease VIII